METSENKKEKKMETEGERETTGETGCIYDSRRNSGLKLSRRQKKKETVQR